MALIRFFLYFTPDAPHTPAVPAPGDEKLFSDFVHRGRSYKEADVSDKPSYVQDRVDNWLQTESSRDEHFRNQLRSLQAVDRAVAAFVDEVERQGKMDETVFVFTSDNGLFWGEHWIAGGKIFPYEESIRVPFAISVPGITPRTDKHLAISSLDIPATIFDLAGIETNTDGASLMPLLENPNASWRDEFFFENNAVSRSLWQTWAGLRSEQHKYIEYANGEKEFYDLVKDPFELENQIDNSEYQNIIAGYAQRLSSQKGLTVPVAGWRPPLRQGIVGELYQYQIPVLGGTAPYTWSVSEGSLPRGLSLDPQSGLLQGVPEQIGEYEFAVQVEDSSIATYTQRARAYTKRFRMAVNNTYTPVAPHWFTP